MKLMVPFEPNLAIRHCLEPTQIFGFHLFCILHIVLVHASVDLVVEPSLKKENTFTCLKDQTFY